MPPALAPRGLLLSFPHAESAMNATVVSNPTSVFQNLNNTQLSETEIRRLLKAATLGSLECMGRLADMDLEIPEHFVSDMLRLALFHLYTPPGDTGSDDHATNMARESLLLLFKATFIKPDHYATFFGPEIWAQIATVWPWIRRFMSINDRYRLVRRCGSYCDNSTCVAVRDNLYAAIADTVRCLVIFHKNKNEKTWWHRLPDFMKIFVSLCFAEIRLQVTWDISESIYRLDFPSGLDAFCSFVESSGDEAHETVKLILRRSKTLASEFPKDDNGRAKLDIIISALQVAEPDSALFQYSVISNQGSKALLDVLGQIVPSSWQQFQKTFGDKMSFLSACIEGGLGYIMKTFIVTKIDKFRRAIKPALRRKLFPVLLQIHDFADSVIESRYRPDRDRIWLSIANCVDNLLHYVASWLFIWPTFDRIDKILGKEGDLDRYEGPCSVWCHFLKMRQSLVKLRDQVESKRKCHNAGCTSRHTLDSPLRCCSGCDNVEYCSKDCQRRDWSFHRGQCHSSPWKYPYATRLYLRAIFNELVPEECMQDLQSARESLIEHHGQGTKVVFRLDLNILPWKISAVTLEDFLQDGEVDEGIKEEVLDVGDKQVLNWRIVKMGKVTYSDFAVVDYQY